MEKEISTLKNRILTNEDKKSLLKGSEKNKRESLFKGLTVLLSNISFWVILFYFAVPSLPGWGVKNWLPTLFAENLQIEMSLAGPLSTITIAASSFIGVLFGGILSDRWVQKNIRGRIYTSAIGLGLTIPALLLIGLGSSMLHMVGAVFFFGFGYRSNSRTSIDRGWSVYQFACHTQGFKRR